MPKDNNMSNKPTKREKATKNSPTTEQLEITEEQSLEENEVMKGAKSSKNNKVAKKLKAAVASKEMVDTPVTPEVVAPTAQDIEAKKTRLKKLIVQGKERGYLTYAEINDHLPDDMLDAEQIEG
ncbi:MAG TPA: RNA polymerase sigma factor region1.1 domain-containing protein, partial [Nitrosomonas sp.]|nr:RNA polymerase sigma factor region1.1 domain-containing protein [Nitrosomonas sp.]